MAWIVRAGASEQNVLVVLGKAFRNPFMLTADIGQHQMAEFVRCRPVRQKTFQWHVVIHKQLHRFSAIPHNTAKSNGAGTTTFTVSVCAAVADRKNNNLWGRIWKSSIGQRNVRRGSPQPLENQLGVHRRITLDQTHAKRRGRQADFVIFKMAKNGRRIGAFG